MSPAEALIRKLEILLDALPSAPTLEVIAHYVEARAPLASALASLEESSLPLGERLAMAPRLARVLERDRPLLAALLSRREEVAVQLRDLSVARTAAHGYRGGGASSRLLRKTA